MQIDRSVAAAERALTILNAFLEGGGDSLSLTELEQRTRLFKSVILRYMLSFEKHGYIRKQPDGSYRLGPAVYQLGQAYERTFDLSETLHPLLRTLAAGSGESASFYVREGERRMCLLRVTSEQVVQVNVKPGTLRPIDGSAAGQWFSACASPMPPLETLLADGWTRHTSGVGDPLTASIAAPVFGAGERLLGVMTISAVASRFDDADPRCHALLAEAAQQASRQLGARLPLHTP